MGATEPEPSLMRNLGAFFGHIVQAIKEDPDGSARDGHRQPDPEAGEGEGAASGASESLEVRREVQEARHGPFLLRRTTIDEVIRTPEGEPDPKANETACGDERPRA